MQLNHPYHSLILPSIAYGIGSGIITTTWTYFASMTTCLIDGRWADLLIMIFLTPVLAVIARYFGAQILSLSWVYLDEDKLTVVSVLTGRRKVLSLNHVTFRPADSEEWVMAIEDREVTKRLRTFYRFVPCSRQFSSFVPASRIGETLTWREQLM